MIAKSNDLMCDTTALNLFLTKKQSKSIITIENE